MRVIVWTQIIAFYKLNMGQQFCTFKNEHDSGVFFFLKLGY